MRRQWAVGLLIAAHFMPAQAQVVPPETTAEREQRMAQLESRRLADAFGTAPLLLGPTPNTTAEIRVAISYGWPVASFRVVDSAGTVWGEKAISWADYYWPRGEDSTNLADLIRPDGCAAPIRKGQDLTCRIHWRETPDWSLISARLDSAGVWSLPAPTLEGGADGWSVTVEARRGSAYQLRYYWMPSRQSREIDRLAKAILAVLDTLPRLKH